MIDLHCHILPGVDDGAQTLEDSLAMAKIAVEQGIDTIIATPHHHNGKYKNSRMEVLQKVAELNYELERENIPVEILPGQEIRLEGEIIHKLNSEELLPVNITSGYVFIELPSDQVPNYTKNVFYELQRAGYKPIIVHPERNRRFIKQPDLLYQLVKNGAITQLTAGSIVGKAGRDVQKFAYQLIEANLTHIIASDAHDVKKRGFFLREAYDRLTKRYGSYSVYQFMENTNYVLNGEMVFTDPPERIKKKLLKVF